MLRYVSHPEVEVDPAILVPDWELSRVGHRRAAAVANAPWVVGLQRIVSSSERKAQETAAYLAEAAGLVVEVRPETAEIDRSSTGYLSHDEHDEHANRLFAEPDASVNGWERAIDAQARMVASVQDLLSQPGDVAMVGHGGVGTLLWCHLAGEPIARSNDQVGGGHVWTYDTESQRMLGGWRRFEDELD